MSFTYPLGLLGLLAIPLLILIYILKNKHTEQVIPSTYLWTLSERFLKRRSPISRLTGIISLILQIAAVCFISFGIAHPVFTLKNAADDYLFILDGSGSMAFEMDGDTRFDLAKEEIEDVIDGAATGSRYTLVYAGANAGVLFENVEDKKAAIDLLAEVAPSAGAANVNKDARKLAQEYFNANPSTKIYLLTDKDYASLTNVELIRIASKEDNYAVADVMHTFVEGKLKVSGKVTSYERDCELSVRLDVIAQAGTETHTKQIPTVKGEETEFSFQLEVGGFSSLKVAVENEDALPLDNECVLYNRNDLNKEVENNVLIVSDDPFFLQMALTALVGENGVDTVKKTDYNNVRERYQLYVFESYSPDVLPEGAVWFVNPQSSVENAGFSVQGVETFPTPRKLKYSTSTATRIRALMKDTRGSEISLKEYVKCNPYRNFHTVLSFDGNPVVMAGTNGVRKRTVVIGFDLHKSDIVLQYDYMPLMRNLFYFTSPAMVEENLQDCGKAMPINVLADSESLRIDTPDGEIVYLDTGSDMIEYTLDKVGTYKITQVRANGVQEEYVYGYLSKTERNSWQTAESFSIEGTPLEERRDGRYDNLIVLLILLATIFLADWMVYCYEQHQLR